MISEEQYIFMMIKIATDGLAGLRLLMDKYREGQKELHCVFLDLENAFDRKHCRSVLRVASIWKRT